MRQSRPFDGDVRAQMLHRCQVLRSLMPSSKLAVAYADLMAALLEQEATETDLLATAVQIAFIVARDRGARGIGRLTARMKTSGERMGVSWQDGGFPEVDN